MQHGNSLAKTRLNSSWYTKYDSQKSGNQSAPLTAYKKTVICFADSSKILFNTQGTSVQSAMPRRLQNNIYFLSAKQQMQLTKRSKYCVPNGQGNLPPLDTPRNSRNLESKTTIPSNLYLNIWINMERNKQMHIREERIPFKHLPEMSLERFHRQNS